MATCFQFPSALSAIYYASGSYPARLENVVEVFGLTPISKDNPRSRNEWD